MAPAALRPMTQDEYVKWSARSVQSYAADLERADGLTKDEAARRAREVFAELLPAHRNTAGTWLMRVLDDGGLPVGVLWIGPHPQRADAAWVYDVFVDPARRGHGLGRRAMLAAEELARDAGLAALGLNVFAHNPQAEGLYASLGYAVVSQQMIKEL